MASTQGKIFQKPVVFELPTVYGSTKSTKSMRGKLALLVYEGPQGHLQNQEAHNAIKDAAVRDPSILDDFDMMAIVNLGPVAVAAGYESTANFIKRQIYSAIESYSKDTAQAVYIDENGDVAKAFELDDTLSHIILLDETSNCLIHQKGPAENIKALMDAIMQERALFRQRAGKSPL